MNLSVNEFSRGKGWFILPSAFEEMFSRLSRDYSKESLSAAAINFKPKDSGSDFYLMEGSTAVIPINGPIMKRASFFSFLFGGTSYAFVRRAMREALEDSGVESIVLRIDSPGGVVNGVEETGDLIFNSRGKKPIVAYNDGQMMSAAYWLGSSADEIVSGKTSGAGSIGVLMVHEDWSRWNEKAGILVTYLTAGKYKALGNPDQPLTELAKETFQMELDYLYSIFVDTVARNRDVEESDVLANMADGRVFIGQLAVDAGLIDKIGDFKSAVSMAQDMAGAASKKNGRIITMEKTIEELRVEYPDLVKQIEEKAKAGVVLDTPVAEAR